MLILWGLDEFSLEVHAEVSMRINVGEFSPQESQMCVCVFLRVYSPELVSSLCLQHLYYGVHSAVFQRCHVQSLSLHFCSATLFPLVSRISLTSHNSPPFKWGGLLLKSWEGALHVKPILTLLTLLILALHLSQLAVKKKSMRIPQWSSGCERKNVRF